jgi:hypothetical protein
MKKLLMIFLVAAGLNLFAQEAPSEEVPPPEPGALTGTWRDSVPKTWKEWVKGLTLELEAGSHEYPLDIWYPDQYEEGYSIRSFYLKPRISYGKTIADITGLLNLEFTADLQAPDPVPGAAAINAREADRKPWFTLLVEQDFDYPLSHLFDTKVNFPGLLGAFLHHENTFYIAPEFPEAPPRQPEKAKKLEGTLEPGFFYSYGDFPIGELRTRLGLPLHYINRLSDKLGFGMNFSAGYTDGYGIGISVDVVTKMLFIPQVEYKETELVISYTWADFSVVLDTVAYGVFETFLINPEMQYRIRYNLCEFVFYLGFEISDIGNYTAFSPYLGMNWSW